TPTAAVLHLFAETNAFIVAPELDNDAGEIGRDHQVGSGPFKWVEWNDQRFASTRRNTDWFGGNQRPYLDGLSLVQPANTGEVEAAIRTKQIDVATVGRPLADRLKRALPQLVENTVGHSLFFSMRFSLHNHPYDDLRFRNAVTYAIDKRQMIGKFFNGSGGVNPWISWPVSRWTLPESELTQYAGYRPGDGGRAEDLREAKAFFEAFLADKQLPEYDNGLPLFVLDSSEFSIGLGSEIRDQLQANLGLATQVYPMPLAQLVNLLLTAEAPFAVGPDTGWIDLDDWVYPYFHSNGTKNTFPLRDTEIDSLIEAQRVEFDEANRRQIGYEIQRRLLAVNAGVNLVSERVVTLAWPYVKGFPLDTADGYQHRFADTWIDRADPTFQGR
ncbi:MAG TPA: ABC transporter substrate-binding protein, partial [Tepidiformaceae bacterium]|nr:ABC transporter substrate-binding protein [Tepidiformaceae bacterium]